MMDEDKFWFKSMGVFIRVSYFFFGPLFDRLNKLEAKYESKRKEAMP